MVRKFTNSQTLLETIWERPRHVVRGWGNTSAIFPEEWIEHPVGDPGFPSALGHQRPPAGDRWRRYWQFPRVIKGTTPGPRADGNPVGRIAGPSQICRRKSWTVDYLQLWTGCLGSDWGTISHHREWIREEKTVVNTGFYRDEFQCGLLHDLHYFLSCIAF